MGFGKHAFKVSKLGRWVPHTLSEKNKADRLRIASDLLNRYESDNLNLDSIVTGDEKWVLYVNVIRRRQWVNMFEEAAGTSKAGLHPKKCLLSLFWDTEGLVHWEILPKGQTINAQTYCLQLERLRGALEEKRPHKQNVLFLHDNATPHTAKITKANFFVKPNFLKI